MKIALLAALLLTPLASLADESQMLIKSPECMSYDKNWQYKDNQSYVGKYYGTDDKVPVDALVLDEFCADQFRRLKYPKGFVTVFGGNDLKDEVLLAQLKEFAEKWTRQSGAQIPIMSGAGLGAMQAVARGAMQVEANGKRGPSIGYTSWFVPNKYTPKDVFSDDEISDGLVFSSIAVRESAMIRASAAMVFAPGGTGTYWELSQTLDLLKNGKLSPIKVYLVGKKSYWSTYESLFAELVKGGFVKGVMLNDLVEFVENPVDLPEKMKGLHGM